MKEEIYNQQLQPIRRWIVFFMIALTLSGLTVWPAETELRAALSIIPKQYAAHGYLQLVLEGYQDLLWNKQYLLYGYDWLVFAHLVLGVLFIGPYRDPVRNVWVIEFGMIACLFVFPFAFIAGSARGIPVWWRCVDCSFGVFGFMVLHHCYKKIRMLEREKRIADAAADRLSSLDLDKYPAIVSLR